MKTYAIPVTFYVEAISTDNAEATLLGALGYLEDNSALRTHAEVLPTVGTVDFSWKLREPKL